ncbi:MAG: hypothetical protein GY941_30505 [Planctomycetes bacterium]|nr:hypothetical protein [Planctomycetota bacterium]
MDYDKAYTERCKCGEPATITIDSFRTSEKLLRGVPVKIGYCLGCYAKTIKQLTGVSDAKIRD